MQWIKTTIYTKTQGIEDLCYFLGEEGFSGVEIEDAEDFNEFLETNSKYWDYVDEELKIQKQGETKIIFYIENDAEAENNLEKINDLLIRLKNSDTNDIYGSLKLETSGIDEEDWANNWKEYFKPIEIGQKILIQPEWCPYDKTTQRTVFTVNPGMTFGTGTHASTKMCICELEKYITPSTTLLDCGCGSGILSVISLMLGAKEAVAVDIDENCIHVAHENAARNGVDGANYTVYSGDVTSDQELFDKISGTKYDVIVANIVADVIISLLPTVQKLIAKDGVFICSGIIKERLPDVEQAMESHNISIFEVTEQDGWAAITCKF